MNYQIKTIDDLDQAIIHLKSLERAQSEALKMRLSDPDELFCMLTKLIFKLGTRDELLERLFIHPLTAFLSRMGLPFLLNKTLLRNANVFVKGLVILVFQKASGITKQLLNSVLDELVHLFQRSPNDLVQNRRKNTAN